MNLVSLTPNIRYQFDTITYQVGTGEICSVDEGGVSKSLEPSLRFVLELLIMRAGEVVTYEELSPNKIVTPGAVNTAISRIKKQLPGDWIENIKGTGYRLVRQPQIYTPPPKASNSRWRGSMIVLVSLLVAAVALVSWLTRHSRPVEVLAVAQITDRDGVEDNGMLSPDGRWLAYEYYNDIFLKNVATGQETQLTKGFIDELNTWSRDSQVILIHRTDAAGNCTLQEYRIEQRALKQLLECHQGLKSLGADYGANMDIVYFTDNNPQENRQSIYQFERVSGHIQRLFSISGKGHGIYRVYYYDGHIIFLSSTDWASTDVYSLTLASMENRLITHFQQPQISIALDRADGVLFGLSDDEVIRRIHLNSGKTDELGLPFLAEARMSYNTKLKQLIIDGKYLQGRQLVKLANPLISETTQELETIVSSGSDTYPKVCGSYLYYLSNRTGVYEIWRYHQQQRTNEQFSVELGGLPNSIAFTSDCQQMLVVYNKQSVITPADQWLPLSLSINNIFQAEFSLDNPQIIIFNDTEGRLSAYDRQNDKVVSFVDAPKATSFIQINGRELYLKDYNHDWVWEYSIESGIGERFNLPDVISNYRWQKTERGIYFLADGSTPFVGYFDFASKRQVLTELDESYIAATLSVSEIDGNVWLSQKKRGQKNIYKIQLDN